MPNLRPRIHREVKEALRQGRVTRSEEYHLLLQSYEFHEGLVEGQEALGVEARPDGAVVDEQLMTDESDGPGEGEVDTDRAGMGMAEEEAPLESGAEPRVGDEPRAGVTTETLVDAWRADEGAEFVERDIRHSHMDAPRTGIEMKLDHERNSLHAALTAVASLGGCTAVEELLGQRLDWLGRRQGAMTSELRVCARAMQLERHEGMLKLRAEDAERDREEKLL